MINNAPEVADSTRDTGMPAASPDNFMQNLAASMKAQNSQPFNPVTNTQLPATLEEALLVIEQQQQIIAELQQQNRAEQAA